MKNIAIVSKKSVKFSLKQSRFREENLKEKIFEIDTDLLSLLRAIGARVMSMLLTMLTIQVTNQIKKPGWKIQRRPQIKYTTIFGELEIESPYLCHKKLKKGIRPVAEGLGITAGKHSLGLTRAKRGLWCRRIFWSS